MRTPDHRHDRPDKTAEGHNPVHRNPEVLLLEETDGRDRLEAIQEEHEEHRPARCFCSCYCNGLEFGLRQVLDV